MINRIIIILLVLHSGLSFALNLSNDYGDFKGSLQGRYTVTDNGAFIYQLPLKLPYDNYGYQPSLSIDYNTQNRRKMSGLIGYSTSFGGISKIYRCERSKYIDGKISTVSGTDSDALCYNNNRMILRTGEHFKNGAVYDIFNNVDISIEYIERDKSFISINKKTGEKEFFNFKTINKKNTPYAWLVSYSEDVYSRKIEYEYEGYTWKVSSQPKKISFGDTEVKIDYYWKGNLLEDKAKSISIYKGGNKIETYNMEYDSDKYSNEEYLLKSITRCVTGYSCYNSLEVSESKEASLIFKTNINHEILVDLTTQFNSTKNEIDLYNSDYNYFLKSKDDYTLAPLNPIVYVTRVRERSQGELRNDKVYKYGGLRKVDGYNHRLQFMFRYEIEDKLITKYSYSAAPPSVSQLMKIEKIDRKNLNTLTSKDFSYDYLYRSGVLSPRPHTSVTRDQYGTIYKTYEYRNGLLSDKEIKTVSNYDKSNENIVKYHYEYDKYNNIKKETKNIKNNYSNYQFVSHFVYNDKLNLTENKIINNNGSFKKIYKEYNSHGQIVKKIESSNDVLPNYVKLSESQRNILETNYTYNGNYLSSEKNKLGHTISYEFNEYCSKPSKIVDANGLVRNFNYDPFCRIVTEDNGKDSTTQYKYEVAHSSRDTGVPLYSVRVTGKNKPIKETLFDGFGTIVSESEYTLSTKLNSSSNIRYNYDEKGRIIKKTQPYSNFDKEYFIYRSYDALGRVLSEETHSGSTFYSYNGNIVIETKPNGSQVETTFDSFIRPVYIKNSSNSEINFNYDALGNIIESSVNGIKTEIAYDAWGNRKSIKSPSFGHKYFYTDAFSNLIWKKNELGHIVEFSFDQLGRKHKEKYFSNDGKLKKQNVFNWDESPNGIGKFSSVYNSESAFNFEYDDNGFVSKVIESISGVSYQTDFYNDEQGNVILERRPDGLELKYNYVGGYLESISRLNNKEPRRKDIIKKAKDLQKKIKVKQKANIIKNRSYSQKVDSIINELNELREYYLNLEGIPRHSYVRDKVRLIDRKLKEANIVYNDLYKMERDLKKKNTKKLEYLEVIIAGKGELARSLTENQFLKFYNMYFMNFKKINSSHEEIWKAINYNAQGRVDQYVLGNIYRTVDSYNPITNKIVSSYTSDDDYIRDINYSYDKNNNLSYIEDNINNFSHSILHDENDRVITSQINEGLVNEYTYDEYGNFLEYKNEEVKSKGFDNPYQLDRYRGNKFTYDLIGRLKSGRGINYKWDVIGKPSVIENNSNKLELYYSVFGGLSLEKLNGLKTISTSSGYEVKQSKGGFLGTKNYVYANGAVVAVITKEGKLGTETNYLFKDSLGSIDTILSDTGTIKQRYFYDAFGKRTSKINNQFDGKLGYTGHKHFDNFDLIYMKGRVYDPIIGRFISPDPNVTNPYDPENYNRYSYVLNSPFKYTDPTGYDAVSVMYEVVVTAPRDSNSWGYYYQDDRDAWMYRQDLDKGNYDINNYNANGKLDDIIFNSASFSGKYRWGDDREFLLGYSTNTQDAELLLALIPFAKGVRFIAILRNGKYVTNPTVHRVIANGARGRASEARVLKDLGLAKNTTKVKTAEGNAIPDALTNALSLEIKDLKYISFSKQLRIQTGAARASGRQSVLVTGEHTRISSPTIRAFDQIIRRIDLGPGPQ